MRKAAMILTALMILFAAMASAAEWRGSVKRDGDADIFVMVGSSQAGPMMVTLSWQKRTADLDLFVSCMVGDQAFLWGVSVTQAKRFDRVEVGVLSGQLCLIRVSSFGGPTTNYYLTIDLAGGGPIALEAGSERSRSNPMADRIEILRARLP